MRAPSSAACLAAQAIAWYQTRLSPHKGYACAHRVAHGGDSCSQAVRRSVLDRGLPGAVLPSLARLAACWQAVALLTPHQRVQGVCCCGPVPIPFRFGRR
ncbi:membrane protein insertion efficiency factor YidD [Pseudokineococcus marinus]|uniref:membrane protein insertion efficiency factor YidD n=1 Tax=Pseudokineococcus marinus TaxID=351215 RepID=UPI001BB2DA49|nr:membrane protein insertion efficiency factor YidD [Pseudokineococcus marinus]